MVVVATDIKCVETRMLLNVLQCTEKLHPPTTEIIM